MERRLDHSRDTYREKPMMNLSNIHYEMSDRMQALDCGGIGAIAEMVKNIGLIKAIDEKLHLFKVHLPYHESDHVLNFAFNILAGGECMGDMELIRTNEAYLDAMDAKRTPDPTTAGDFTRRFKSEGEVMNLQEIFNSVRLEVWKKRFPKADCYQAIIDMDGTVAKTYGECKEGMDISYKKIWGYHPLIISLAKTMETLYLVNRPGNSTSSDGAAPYVDKAIDLVSQNFCNVLLRGDTDFSQTVHLDRWDRRKVKFIFGMDAMPNLVALAQNFEEKAWKPLKRRVKRVRKTEPRQRPANVKEKIVEERGYKNKKLVCEHVAEFSYQPTKCKKPYRMVVLRKNITVEQGGNALFDEIEYFFYITNNRKDSSKKIVFTANDRCNQENLIEQMKNGFHALRMPAGDLISNWAYMVMVSLAWTLKAWWAMQIRSKTRKEQVMKMEFRQFVNVIIRMPCQIVRTGRRTLYRILSYNSWTETFLRTFAHIRKLKPGYT